MARRSVVEDRIVVDAIAYFSGIDSHSARSRYRTRIQRVVRSIQRQRRGSKAIGVVVDIPGQGVGDVGILIIDIGIAIVIDAIAHLFSVRMDGGIVIIAITGSVAVPGCKVHAFAVVSVRQHSVGVCIESGGDPFIDDAVAVVVDFIADFRCAGKRAGRGTIAIAIVGHIS